MNVLGGFFICLLTEQYSLIKPQIHLLRNKNIGKVIFLADVFIVIRSK